MQAPIFLHVNTNLSNYEFFDLYTTSAYIYTRSSVVNINLYALQVVPIHFFAT